MGKVIGWVTVALLVTLVFGTMYVVVQQAVRASANTEPAAMVAREVQLLAAGSGILAGDRVELVQDTGPFLIVYRADGSPVQGTVVRDDVLPSVPKGVLDAALTHGEDRVTWQPAPGLRFALVARPAVDGRVVVGGRSLAPFEDQDRQSLLLIGLGWQASLVLMVASGVLLRFVKPAGPQRPR